MASATDQQTILKSASEIGAIAIPEKTAQDGVPSAESYTDTPRPLQPWEKPEFAGTSRRHLRTVQRYVWDDPDKPKEEKWFLLKLDIFLLTSACLGYFSKNLDQANINNAYVSGMKEALKMNGSELTYAGNVFTAGYVIGQLPAVILVTRVRPSILIPTLEVFWSILTFCSSAAKNVSHLYAIRFLVGLCESAYFPVMIYLVGSWYTKEERGKRLVIFYSTAALAGMFSGYIQAGAYKGLNGRMGLEGWQWLFIICGVISLPIAFIGYALYPDFPETTKAWYITEKEAQFARDRLVKEGLTPLGASQWDRTKILRIARQWQFWLLPIGYFLVQSSFPIYQPVFAIWLKSTHHTIYQANVWPTGQVAVGVVVQWLAGMISDSPLLRGRRWQMLVIMQSGTIFGCIVLSIWNVPIGLKYVAFYMSFFASGVPGIYFAWYVDLIPHDHEMRGFVIAASNMFSFIQSLWYTNAVWRTIHAPRFKAAFTACSALGSTLILFCLLVRFLSRRDQKIRELERQGLTDVETPVESIAPSETAGNHTKS
jgi:ACS family pantothenate transporter-like MFS transporter